MPSGKVNYIRVSHTDRFVRSIFISSERRIQQDGHRVVVSQNRGRLFAQLQLKLLLDFSAGILPENGFEVAFYDSESPTDGVVEAESSEPFEESAGWAVFGRS